MTSVKIIGYKVTTDNNSARQDELKDWRSNRLLDDLKFTSEWFLVSRSCLFFSEFLGFLLRLFFVLLFGLCFLMWFFKPVAGGGCACRRSRLRRSRLRRSRLRRRLRCVVRFVARFVRLVGAFEIWNDWKFSFIQTGQNLRFESISDDFAYPAAICHLLSSWNKPAICLMTWSNQINLKYIARLQNWIGQSNSLSARLNCWKHDGRVNDLTRWS